MVKCPCGKEIVFKGWEEIEEEEDSRTGMYAGTSHGGSYRAKPQSDRKIRKVRIYACEDFPNCIHSYKMTEDEYLKLEEDHSDDF